MFANTELQRVGTSGWRTGLANLLRKENRAWWASRRWLVQMVVWAVIVNGLLALSLFVMPLLFEMGGRADVDTVDLGLVMLFRIGGVALAIGAVILVQDAI
jgi:hypothetical protein